MFLEFIIYLVVVIVIALSTKSFAESVEDLWVTKGDSGLGSMTVSVSSVMGCYYFFNESIAFIDERIVKWEFTIFLGAGIGLFAFLYVIHQCLKDRGGETEINDISGEDIVKQQEDSKGTTQAP